MIILLSTQQPVWRDTTTPAANSKVNRDVPALDGSETEYDTDIEIISGSSNARDALWPSSTHLIYPVSGAKITLKPQRMEIQRVAQGAIDLLTVSMCFENAFPDLALRTQFIRDALHGAATDLGFESIAKRVMTDVNYVEVLAGLVCIC